VLSRFEGARRGEGPLMSEWQLREEMWERLGGGRGIYAL